MSFAAIIVAAGAGVRAGAGAPKQWRPLGGKAVIRWSVEAMAAAGANPIIAVVAAGDEALAREALADLEGWFLAVGGVTRAQSVAAGLSALADGADPVVLIHDAARPFLEPAHIRALVDAVGDADGAIPVLAVADTLKRLDDNGVTTVARDGLWHAQTPQAFRTRALKAAYAAWSDLGPPTDDAAVIERAGGKVVFVPGDPMLFKLTHPEDFAMAERLTASRRVTCVGQGFDAHRFGPGDGVWLCGVRIAHGQSLVGHSDADAPLHALTDAVLGALGEGDIGEHFPASDPRWKGATSDRFLLHAADLVRQKGGRVINVDVTVICEAPRLADHRASMRARLSELLDLPMASVSVKATTTEGMGFTGRGEGIAAQAIATVELPAP
jgi:2-C-methyl-D-erythritol 4-phosphate cytidylyltransferase/2-C-methyl-D-erythritol 2,4-cyclodiphosphate synthase